MVHPEDPYRSIVQPVEYTRASRKVIQLLRRVKIPRVEDHAEHPARQSKVSKSHVIFPEWVGRGYPLANLVQAILMREEVKERKQDGEWLLHSQEPVEGPFAVILDDGLQHGRIPRNPPVRDDVLADIVAIGGAGPEEEPEMEG